MPFACARALRVCALLALPASAFAQSTKGPTVFSPTTQLGTVTLRAAVVLPDYSLRPLPLMQVVAVRTDRPDSIASQTDLDGRLSMALRVGTYTLKAKTQQPVGGRWYAWAVRVVVRPQRTEQVQLANANATIVDAAVTSAVVASAPPAAAQPAPPKPVAQRPVQPAGDNNKVVATVQPPKQAAPAPAPAPRPPAAAPQPPAAAPQPPAAAPQPPAAAPQPAPAPAVSTPPAAAQPAPMPAQPSPFTESPRRIAAAHARRTNTSGLMLGLSFDASSIQSDDLTSSRESGPGVGGTLGWGLTKNFAMVIDGSAARISSLGGDFDLAHVDVGGRWHFVNRSAFVPFVEVGYAGRAATKKDAILSDGQGNSYTGSLSIMGGGISAGGGFEYFATSSLALGGAFKWTSGQFTRVKVENVTIDGLELDATSARFNMGFTWYPMGR